MKNVRRIVSLALVIVLVPCTLLAETKPKLPPARPAIPTTAGPSQSPTGASFKPVNITTGPLSMTGMRFQPVSITTGPLSMTGNRPVAATP